MNIALVAISLVLLALIALQFWRSAQFADNIQNRIRRLADAQVGSAPDQSLIPQLMKDYATRNGGRLDGPTVVVMVQKAEMRLGVDQPFFQLEASQRSGTRSPGFVWQAKGTMRAVVPLQVVDCYVEGQGALEVRLAGSITVANSAGPETSKGEAMRFLAELPWNPDAILNAHGLTWRRLDAASVEVSMLTSGGIAQVTLGFDAAGDIVSIAAAERPRAGDTPARWVGRFSRYTQIGSYRFPSYGEIAWDLPQGEFIYWRGDIISLTPNAP